MVLVNRIQVYPRVRGGTVKCAAASLVLTGLSPRARGNRLRDRIELGVDGSIPACAGEPRTFARERTVTTVYPRVRGGTACARR